jgi:hypothetical protein
MRPAARELALYLVAAAVYIGIGIYNTNFLLSWPVAAGYLLVVAWLLPAAIRRLL